jgi:hypothetical protein
VGALLALLVAGCGGWMGAPYLPPGPAFAPPPGAAPYQQPASAAPPAVVPEAVPPYYESAEPVPTGAPLDAPSSVLLPVLDRDLLWHHLVDVVDDYFKINREQRVQQQGDILLEGHLETFPETSPTVFEPWRADAATPLDRWENTLQSIRRQAQVRVIPAPQGYQVEIAVLKELEDVERPEIAGVSGASLRNDNSVHRYESPTSGRRRTLGWISLGRDVGLEQRILSDLRYRFGGAPW